ncbi:MAG: hypothetical protein C0502_11245 [Opitutus sp.]|nr:hypothetical protein [Opitutus sp.]
MSPAWILIPSVALAASLLTLFSGFGLGTLLLPAVALFFPLETAIAVTALVHLANNLYKLALFGRRANRRVVGRFGLPAIAGAFAGAWALDLLGSSTPVWSYELGGRMHAVTGLKLTLALLMTVFALWEVLPRLARLGFPPRWLPAGGLLSGFFGGLSGHQGALRSAFLVRLALSKEEFVGTGVVIACLVDSTRLAGYAANWRGIAWQESGALLLVTAAAAVAGATIGARLLPKTTVAGVQGLVSALLLAFAAALAAGLI